jgi:hypothetical protein
VNHLDEGPLLTLRDGGNEADEEARAHLEACTTCREALEALHATEERVADALTSLDADFDIDAAREQVRARVTAQAAEASGSPSIVRSPGRGTRALGRAAILVLLTAAGASALTWSPLRTWIAGAISSDDPATAETTAASTRGERANNAGIRVTVTGAARVSILGVAPGDDVTVLWVPGSEVAVFAGDESRFSSAEGLVQATVSGGPVHIELPVGVHPLTLEVGGRIWLRSLSSGAEYSVSALARRRGLSVDVCR